MANRYAKYTEQELLKDAYQVQNGCNLSGIVLSFADAVLRVRELMSEKGVPFSTDDVNHHPVCRLFACKIVDLAGEPTGDDWNKAMMASKPEWMLSERRK